MKRLKICISKSKITRFLIRFYKFKFPKSAFHKPEEAISVRIENPRTEGRASDFERFSEHRKSAQMPIPQRREGHLHAYSAGCNLERNSVKNEENQVLEQFAIGRFTSLQPLASSIRPANFG